MQVVCKSSEDAAETHCRVCGQGFQLVWERQSKMERAEALREIDRTLRGHHRSEAGPEAHPTASFTVKAGHDPASVFSAAGFGPVPSWSL